MSNPLRDDVAGFYGLHNARAKSFLDRFPLQQLEYQLGSTLTNLSQAYAHAHGIAKQLQTVHSMEFKGGHLWLSGNTHQYCIDVGSADADVRAPYILPVASHDDVKLDKFSVLEVQIDPTHTGLKSHADASQVHCQMLFVDASRQRLLMCSRKLNDTNPALLVDLTGKIQLNNTPHGELIPHLVAAARGQGASGWWLLAMQAEMPHESYLVHVDVARGFKMRYFRAPRAQEYKEWDPDLCQMVRPPFATEEWTALRAMNRIQDLVVDNDGRVWIMNQVDNRIDCFDPNTECWQRVPCLDVFYAIALATDRLGYVYIADRVTDSIWKFHGSHRPIVPVQLMGPNHMPFKWRHVPLAMTVDHVGQVYLLSESRQQVAPSMMPSKGFQGGDDGGRSIHTLEVVSPFSNIVTEQLALMHALHQHIGDIDVVRLVVDFCRAAACVPVDDTGISGERLQTLISGSAHDKTRTHADVLDYERRCATNHKQRLAEWRMWQPWVGDRQFCARWMTHFAQQSSFYDQLIEFRKRLIASHSLVAGRLGGMGSVRFL